MTKLKPGPRNRKSKGNLSLPPHSLAAEKIGEFLRLENTPTPGTIEHSNNLSQIRSQQSAIISLEENDRSGQKHNIRYTRKRSEPLERTDGQFESRLLMLLPNTSTRGSYQSTISSQMEKGAEAFLAKSPVGRMVNLLSKRMRRVSRSSKSRKVKKMSQKVVMSPMNMVEKRRK
jgi:hypothetical protein